MWLCRHDHADHDGLQLRHEHHVHGWRLCDGCRARILEGH